jgi:hypothetical protein
MFGNDGDGIEKLYVNPNFRRPDGQSHLVGDLPPLSPKRLMKSRGGQNDRQSTYDESKMSKVNMDCYNNDDDEGYPATLNVDVSRSSRNIVQDSSSNRDINDPMSLDSGVITTLSRYLKFWFLTYFVLVLLFVHNIEQSFESEKKLLLSQLQFKPYILLFENL